MATIRTLFSGGEGVGVGARAAGLIHVDGFEYNDKIAQVARTNGFNTLTADVLTVDPATLQRTDVLHASPVCTNASVANSDGEEAELDRAAARKTAEFVTVLKPTWFTLENVYPYRNFESFGIITNALTEAGYSWDYWHINSADYGVPQTRKRLILIARLGKGQQVTMPPVTHHNPADFEDSQLPMFAPVTLPWVGWYEAIEDLIPTLPESKFAPWQLKRLPEELKNSFISDMQNVGRDLTIRQKGQPFPTVTAQLFRRPIGIPTAFIASGALNDNSATLSTRNGQQPMLTVTTSHNNKDVKAWLVDDGNSKDGCVKAASQPMATVRTNETGGTMARAFLVDGQNAGRRGGGITTVNDSTPHYTVGAGNKGFGRAWLSSGRVVKMTPRALARFQSFPDDYILPDNNSLAVKVIGNAVPPKLYQAIAKMITEQL